MSTTTNPFDATSWQLLGPILPGAYTGGASLLFRDDERAESTTNTKHDHPRHYAFVSDSNTAGSLILLESTDGEHWVSPNKSTKTIFMAGRPDCWDQAGVAAGFVFALCLFFCTTANMT